MLLLRALIFITAAIINSRLVASFSINPGKLRSKQNHVSLADASVQTEIESGSTGTTINSIAISPNILGPPEPLRELQIGQQLNAFRNYAPTKTNFTIERVSYQPDAFILRNFLTSSECNGIQTIAQNSNMEQAQTITQNDTSSRKNCKVAWIPSTGPNKSNLVGNLVSSAANVLLSKSVLSNPSAGVEDLQVLEYGVGGEFVLHHDGEPRVLTVIYYLNGVGGTWFPLARTSNDVGDDPCLDMDTSEMEEGFAQSRTSPQNKAQALNLGEGLKPGDDGLLVKGKSKIKEEVQNEHVALIEQGDALAFYNYCDDGSARLDWRSLHCGLPTSEEDGEKWIANHWFRVNDLVDI